MDQVTPMEKPTVVESGAGEGKVKSLVPTSLIEQESKAIADLKRSFTPDKIKFVKGLINNDLNDNELILFLHFCNSVGLNPYNKEIIAVVYNKSDQNLRTVNKIVARDGKRVIANRHGDLEEITSTAIYTTTTPEGKVVRVQPWEGGTLWGAEARVQRSGKVFDSIVPLSEYDTNRSVWQSKKSTMIKKVAESQALSAAYPELLGGLYDQSEMPTPTNGEAGQTVQIESPDEPATTTQIDALRVIHPELFDKDGLMQKALTKQEVVDIMKEGAK